MIPTDRQVFVICAQDQPNLRVAVTIFEGRNSMAQVKEVFWNAYMTLGRKQQKAEWHRENKRKKQVASSGTDAARG